MRKLSNCNMWPTSCIRGFPKVMSTKARIRVQPRGNVPVDGWQLLQGAPTGFFLVTARIALMLCGGPEDPFVPRMLLLARLARGRAKQNKESVPLRESLSVPPRSILGCQ